jgi:hypothetical protein
MQEKFIDILANQNQHTNQTVSRHMKEVNKGAWRMPRLSEAKKDVISCDKLRVGANNRSSEDFRMGQPTSLKN